MVILFHIIAALISIMQATYLFFIPSKRQLRIAYALTAVTIGSGTYLVWQSKAHMVQSCMSGLAYLGFVSLCIVVAHNKLSREKL
ncbi:MAG TPA: hypothetical protein VLH86_06215 [Patescibacteria group bacterium]|nr:hypothetical protein [Patescibacteria group bacterium]